MWWRGIGVKRMVDHFGKQLSLISATVAAATVPIRSAALPAALKKAGIRELPAQANERALSRWDQETLHAGRPESGPNEQAPCAPAPLVSVHFPGFRWRRRWRTAAVGS